MKHRLFPLAGLFVVLAIFLAPVPGRVHSPAVRAQSEAFSEANSSPNHAQTVEALQSSPM